MKIPCILAILAHLNYGRLRIGANESISWHLFPELAKAFLQLHSGIRIELRCGRSESLLADLKERKLDLFNGQNTCSESLGHERLYVDLGVLASEFGR
jgi:DNA-binding transcriptional LysR family regulator